MPQIQKVKDTEGRARSEDVSAHTYKLLIKKTEDGTNANIKVAISHNSSLDIIEARTPFKHQFSASKYYIFYEVVESGPEVLTELYSDEFGRFRKVSGVRGASGRGKFIRDPRLNLQMCGSE